MDLGLALAWTLKTTAYYQGLSGTKCHEINSSSSGGAMRDEHELHRESDGELGGQIRGAEFVGGSADNESLLVVIGNLQTQIAALQEVASKLTMERDALQSSADGLSEERDALRSISDMITKQRDQAEAEVSEVNKKYEKVENAYARLLAERNHLKEVLGVMSTECENMRTQLQQRKLVNIFRKKSDD